MHVDLDVDVCDRAVAPACPASLPGGLAAHELLAAAGHAGASPLVRSMDLTEVDATVPTRPTAGPSGWPRCACSRPRQGSRPGCADRSPSACGQTSSRLPGHGCGVHVTVTVPR